MTERYIGIMEKSLSAYTVSHMRGYLESVKENGLTEHGFPRLAANLGILIANGRYTELLPLCIEMITVCCKMFLRANAKAANEFSVREIVFSIDMLEQSRVVSLEIIEGWKADLRQIDPTECYNVIVSSEDDRITNWAIFGAVSEYVRYKYGLRGDMEFVERQLSCQFKWIDENGMYCDNPHSDVHQPIMYDLVSRGLFALLLKFGYRGKYYEIIDECLKKSGIPTLKMQSVNGEIAFGGRSNQFIHCEGCLCAVYEYEASRYAREGNLELAKKFKSAILRAVKNAEELLSTEPIHHVKNRFPTESKYGCEAYAYFDKYMITAASNFFCAYLVADDSIPAEEIPDVEAASFMTSHRFHKLFLKSGGYAIELDTNADPHYDAKGLGRVHKAGAEACALISAPCPSNPNYTVDIEPRALSLCSAVFSGGKWLLGCDGDVKYEVLEHFTDENCAKAVLLSHFEGKRTVKEIYKVDSDGVEITLIGDGDIAFILPAFSFDGERSTEISKSEHRLSVSYGGSTAEYTSDGVIIDFDRVAANRNGHFKAFLATGKNNLKVKIKIN